MSKYYPIKKHDIVKGQITYNISGFYFKPRNKVKYEGIEVSEITVLKPELIENILKRKTKIKLNAYLSYLLTIMEDDTDSGEVALMLDDAKRYKAIILNKYSKYLNPSYIKELLFRVRFIEEELKTKIFDDTIKQNQRGR